MIHRMGQPEGPLVYPLALIHDLGRCEPHPWRRAHPPKMPESCGFDRTRTPTSTSGSGSERIRVDLWPQDS